MQNLTDEELELIETIRLMPLEDRTFYQQRIVRVADLIELKEKLVAVDYDRLRKRIKHLHAVSTVRIP